MHALQHHQFDKIMNVAVINEYHNEKNETRIHLFDDRSFIFVLLSAFVYLILN